MARLADLERALVEADRAGDVEAARALAREIQMQRRGVQPAAMNAAMRGLAKVPASLVELPVQAYGAYSAGVNSLLALGAEAAGLRGLARSARGGAEMAGRAARSAPLSEAIDRALPGGPMLLELLSGGIGGAGAGVAAGRALARSARPGVAAVGRELSTAPAMQMAGGIGGALGVGGAMAADAPLPVQVAAGLAGGVAGGSVPVGAAAANSASGMLSGRVPRQVAGETLRNAATNVDASMAALAERGGPQASGALPTVAEVTMDPGLAGLQRSVMSRDVAAGGRLADRQRANQAARMAAVGGVLGNGDVGALSRAATEAARALDRRLARSVDAVGPLVTPEEAGRQLRGALRDRSDAAFARAGRMYDEIDTAEPLQVGGFDDATVVPARAPDADYAESVRSAKAALDPAGDVADAKESLVGWIVRKGGIRPRMSQSEIQERTRGPGGRWNAWRNQKNDRVGDLYRRDVRPGAAGVPVGLFRQAGRMDKGRGSAHGIDDLHGMALAEGVIPPGTSIDDFIEMISDDVAGVRRSSGMDDAHRLAGDFAADLDRMGFNPLEMSDEDWSQYFGRSGPAGPRDFEGQGGRPLGPIQQAIDVISGDFPDLIPSATMRRVLDDVMNADVMTVGQMIGTLRRLRSIAGSRSADGRERALAHSVAKALDGFLQTQATGGQAEQLARARAAYREAAKRFREDEAGRILATRRFSTREDPRFEVDDSKVTQVAVPFGRGGATAGVRLRAAAGDDAAMAATRAELRLQLEGKSAADVDRIAARYSDTLRAYPELRRDVVEARRAARFVESFRRSPLAPLAGDADPQVYVASLLRRSDGRSLAEVAKWAAGNKETAAGFRQALGRAIADGSAGSIVGADGVPVPDAKAMDRLISLVLERTASAPVLTGAQRKVLGQVQDELRRARFAATANRTAGSDTARNATVAASVFGRVASRVAGDGMASSVVRALLRGLEATSQTGAANALLAEAMLDPALALKLMAEPTPERVSMVVSRMPSGIFGGTVATAVVSE